MKIAKKLVALSLIMLFSGSLAMAQSSSLSETFKQHFNETVQQVKAADDADKKRELLNQSFDRMLTAVERIEANANLSKDEQKMLQAYKDEITGKQNQLNGQDGYDEVMDEDLDDFSDYSQQAIEQASRTITISLTTALLIIIILLLL